MRNTEILEILLSLIDAIRADDPHAFEEARRRVGRLKRSSSANSDSRNSKKIQLRKFDPVQIEEIYQRLISQSSRETGWDVLEAASMTRAELVALAKLGDVHVTKSDNVGVIEEKLVEGLIGSRLSSEAIRGAARTG